MPTELQLTFDINGVELPTALDWTPSEEESKRIQFVLAEREEMIRKRNTAYPQFNDRTLVEFIDDSEKRLNAYVLPREMQGKEPWQANFATRAYANKAKALLASVARDVPGMKVAAVDENGSEDMTAGEVMQNLVRHSYNEENPQEKLFFLGWSCLGHGTVLEYEGHQVHTFKQKKITSYDLLTGDVTWKEQELVSQGEPISFEVPIQDLYIKNFYIRDIQEQPSIIWETFYAERDRFESDWGKYKNAKYVKDFSTISENEADTYFKPRWQKSLTSGKGYLVSRYMNVYRDVYRVIANGVELYNGPMPWISTTRKGKGRKVYPIAKTIYEPFATGEFFYGNSMPNSAMGEGDVINTLYNSGLDKTYRSMVPPLLIGQINKDMLDLEDEVVAGDTKIYVDDINQVKQMEIKGISDSDVKMIDLISRGLDLTTLDPQQQGNLQKGVTARATLLADERARQLKGVFFMFMESLWLQKTKLRIANILISYPKARYESIVGADGKEVILEKFRRFNVENATLSDGERGTLAIQFSGNPMEERGNVEAEEEKNASEGKPFEMIAVASDYLERYAYDAQIIPESMWRANQSVGIALELEKVQTIATYFPQRFAANEQIFFEDIIKKYNDSPQRYENAMPMETAGPGGMAQGGQEQGSRLVSDLTGNKRTLSAGNLLSQGT